MTLHEAIIYVLEGYGSAMSSAEIAQEIFDKKLYLQQAGSMAPAKQIRDRARKYPQLFFIEDGKIRLKRIKRQLIFVSLHPPHFPKANIKKIRHQFLKICLLILNRDLLHG